MANNNRGLAKNPIVRIELSSERALTAFNISMTTKTLNDKVDGFYLPQLKYSHELENVYLPQLGILKSVHD